MKRKFICIFTALSIVVTCCLISKKEKDIYMTHLMLSNIEALSLSAEDHISPICIGIGTYKCENNEYVQDVYFNNIILEFDKY